MQVRVALPAARVVALAGRGPLGAPHAKVIGAVQDVLPVEAVVWPEGQAVQLTAELEAEV